MSKKQHTRKSSHRTSCRQPNFDFQNYRNPYSLNSPRTHNPMQRTSDGLGLLLPTISNPTDGTVENGCAIFEFAVYGPTLMNYNSESPKEAELLQKLVIGLQALDLLMYLLEAGISP